MTCQGCGTTENVSEYVPAQTHGLASVPDPHIEVCPQCQQELDDFWSQVGAAAARVGWLTIEIAVRLNPVQWMP